MQVLGPFLPMARQLGRLAMALAEGSSVERIEAAFLGRIAEFDTRLLTLAVIAVSEAQDFNELIRVTVVAGDERVAVAGIGIGPKQDPHLVEVQGRRLTIELERFVTVFRYEDPPGMIGRVGTMGSSTAGPLSWGERHRGHRDQRPTARPSQPMSQQILKPKRLSLNASSIFRCTTLYSEYAVSTLALSPCRAYLMILR
jgi:hypothetical protein